MTDFAVESQIRGYGEWASPIAPADLAKGTRKIEQICRDGDAVVWIESRPEEGGRSAIMRWTPAQGFEDATPRWFSARTTVNSYGGGAMAVRDGVLAFVQYSAEAFPKTRDQRVHLAAPGKLPKPITPPVAATYADLEIDPAHGVIYAVMEETTVKTNGQPTQSLVALDLAGERPPRILAQGGDFYATPRLSPDGMRLCWITWNYPSMPWEGTQLWLADIDPSGALRDPRRIAGSPAAHIDPTLNPVLQDLMRYSDEAIMNPVWSPDGRLYVVSDRVDIDGDRWANICRVKGDTLVAVTQEAAEFAAPPWRLGGASFGFVSEDDIIACVTRDGVWSLARVDTTSGQVTQIETGFSSIAHLHVCGGDVVFLGGTFTAPEAICRMMPDTRDVQIIRDTAPPLTDAVQACIAAPTPITFASGPDGTAQAHAFHYAPQNPHFAAPTGEKPPLIILIHGGPTAAATAGLDLTIPFFTSRGFAVVDVNYRGSTGFGRNFRRAIYGGWGKVDVEDCTAAVNALVTDGHVDPYRVVSRGASSGGYTTLALATFTDLLSAAASRYGISNLEMIAKFTDKLEAHYAELLVGPYPSASKLFRARSPLFHASQIDCPIILFQGTEDPVVPPAQAHVLIDEMNARKLPHAFVFYDGESHGFRQASSIIDSVEKELSFYGTFLGFTPDGPLKPPQIFHHEDATSH
ncbi:prolyl oligopeptidase family serine peptidase [Loktanella sp. SALINAS62]|uniref:S9 family peptidase n=1 Tax=Loktanella sp. SALINAS62 TaxID=2706124 RepID=UPI001B8AD1BA|nr:S9 family peptidase [Loktanella sp. SALINAS62]